MILLQKNFHSKNLHSHQAKIAFKHVLLTSINKLSTKSPANYSFIYNFKLNFVNKSIAAHIKNIFTQKILKHVKVQNILFCPVRTRPVSGNSLIQSANNYFSTFKLFSSAFKAKCLPISRRIFDVKSKKISYSQYLNSLREICNTFVKNVSAKLEIFRVGLKTRSSFFASFSAVGFFSWEDHRITDEDIKKEVKEIMAVFTLDGENNEKVKAKTQLDDIQIKSVGQIDFEKNRLINDQEWKLIYDKKDLIIWKRKIVGLEEEVGDLFEYKVLGRMYDITPLEFFQTQVDLDFRKQWDYLVVILDLVEKDLLSNTELIRWVLKYSLTINRTC